MSADSYFGWFETTSTTVVCDLCGWISPPIAGDHCSGPVINAFYAHFHASCLIRAAAGYYDEGRIGEPHTAAALKALEGLSGSAHACPECGKTNGWCPHRQPPTPEPGHLLPWAVNVPDWIGRP